MARDGSGSYTLPAGNPVSSGTTISSTWANDTLSDLGTEMTASLDRNGKGGMLAVLRGVDGGSSAPAFSFTNETGSGVYRAAAGDIRISVLGSDVVQLTGGVLSVWSGGAWKDVYFEGRAIDGSTIGGTTPAAGTFTTVTATTYVGLPVASVSQQGVQELATQAEVDNDTGGDRLVTCNTLNLWSGAGGGGSNLGALLDVTITTPADNEVLAYDTTSGEWINQTPAEASLATADHLHAGVYEPADATILKQADVDDTPVNGVTTAPISSNWAYDHANAADPHTQYLQQNETITLSGDVSGSGTTSISVVVGNDSHSHTASTLPAASTTTSGVSELATSTETDAGTDATRAVTPDALDGSQYQKIEMFRFNAAATKILEKGGTWSVSVVSTSSNTRVLSVTFPSTASSADNQIIQVTQSFDLTPVGNLGFHQPETFEITTTGCKIMAINDGSDNPDYDWTRPDIHVMRVVF